MDYVIASLFSQESFTAYMVNFRIWDNSNGNEGDSQLMMEEGVRDKIKKDVIEAK